MLAVDLMHEFELGVWKSLFVHLVRLLNAIDPSMVYEMDRRYVVSSVIIQIYGVSNILKLPADSHFWPWGNTQVQRKCIRNEKDGSARLRKSFAGNDFSTYLNLIS